MRYILLSLVMILGCSDRDKAWEFRKILDTGIRDAGSDVRTDFSCQEYLLQEDFYNCGECNNVCSTRDSDQCFGGICSCGELGPCEEGQRCWKGTCYDPDPGEVCDTSSDCPPFRKNCVDGRCKTVNCREFETACPDNYICIQDQCTAVECVPEVCDGIDNDCDGEVDATGGSPLAEFCYSGPDISDINPPCAKGIRICEGGAWSACMNEVPPVPEQGLLGCDGLDNDCDGCVDGVLTDNLCMSAEPTSFDVVYVIDMSGSMSGSLAAVVAATNDFSSTFSGNPAFRFGIITLPSVGADGVSTLHLDLSEFNVFQQSLLSLTKTTGAIEPQWDAVYEITTGELPVTWRESSTRIIIVFTDEAGQSSRLDRGLSFVDESIMCSTLTKGEVLAAVVPPEHSVDFDDCGTIFELTEDAAMMAANLETIISNPCR